MSVLWSSNNHKEDQMESFILNKILIVFQVHIPDKNKVYMKYADWTHQRRTLRSPVLDPRNTTKQFIATHEAILHCTLAVTKDGQEDQKPFVKIVF